MFTTATTRQPALGSCPLTLDQALEIVLSLATENALDARLAEDDGLREQVTRQQTAIEMVTIHRTSLTVLG